MKSNNLNFDLHALANPKSRHDCTLLAQEILAELANIRAHFERAAAECERQQAVH